MILSSKRLSFAIVLICFSSVAISQDTIKIRTAILEESPIYACKDVSTLNKIDTLPNEQHNFLVKNLFYIKSFPDSRFLAIDQRANKLLSFDLKKKIIGVAAKFDYNKATQNKIENISISPDGSLLLRSGGRFPQVSIYDQNIKPVNQFKDLIGLNRSCSFRGNIYSLPFMPDHHRKRGDIRLSIYKNSGGLIKNVKAPAESEHPELQNGGFLYPEIIGEDIFAISAQFPVVQVFDLEGNFKREFEIDDKRFLKRANLNKDGIPLESHNRIIPGVPIFRDAATYNNHLYLLVRLNEPDLEILEIDLNGKIIDTFVYKEDKTKTPGYLIFFTVIELNKKRTFVCTVTRPKIQVVLFQ